MTDEVFADMVGRIDFVAGVVRMELVSMEPVEGSDQGRMQVRQRVIMPIEGFVKSLETMANLATKLVDAGLIRRDEATRQAAPVPLKSTNFG